MPRTVLLGVVFWILVAGGMLAIYAAAYRLCAALNPLAAWVLEIVVIYQAIATKDLSRHVTAIIRPLEKGDIDLARSRLGRIVGRDTGALGAGEISRAAIESVAESTTDAVIAPLFWSFIAGAPGALLYRAANTLDSMVGHRSEAYEKFGKASARIDDVFNWLPARICAAAFCVFHPAVRWTTIRREAKSHSSPNAGWAEAAMAHALGVRLGGDNFYSGQCVHGPVFNPSGRSATAADIAPSLLWMWRVAIACLAVFRTFPVLDSLPTDMSTEAQRPRLKRGAFQIYTGEGKGKSTASMGLMLRALGCGFRVYYLRMLKPRWKTGELAICPNLHPNLTYRNVEQDWILSRSKDIPEHVEAMRVALAAEMDELQRVLAGGEYDVVIVDEINYCIHRGLIGIDRAMALVDARPENVELVFTGRYAAEELMARAGVVTEMRKIKHHFDQGVEARRGIEF